METSLQSPTLVANKADRNVALTFYWIVTALFCAEMCFTAYYELLPQGAEAFARLGFPAGYFRMELSMAKIAGVLVFACSHDSIPRQGMGLCRICDQSRVRTHHTRVIAARSAELESFCAHERVLGGFVFSVAAHGRSAKPIRAEQIGALQRSEPR